MYKTHEKYEWSRRPKNFKTHLEKRGYERSGIELVMQEIIAIIRTDLLRRPKNKGEKYTAESYGHLI